MQNLRAITADMVFRKKRRDIEVIRPLTCDSRAAWRRIERARRALGRLRRVYFFFRIEGVKAIPISNPSGDMKRLTI
jgi:hypothetical protein